jgi:hypothetical protein
MQLNMLESNQIDGIMKPKYEEKDELHNYTYHVPMRYKNISELKINLTPFQVVNILKQIVEGLLICEKHFLLSNRVILHPDLIYINDQLDDVLAIYVTIKFKFDISEKDLIRNLAYQLVDLVGYWDSKSFSDLFALINHGHYSTQKLHALLTLSNDELLKSKYIQRSNEIIYLKDRRKNKKNIINTLRLIIQLLFNKKNINRENSEFVNNELANVFPTTILPKQWVENNFVYYLSENRQNNVNEILIKDGFSKLGRDSEACEILLLLNNVSRRHLEFNLSNGKLQVRDLNSKNGTKLNDLSLKAYKWYSLKEGDSLQIADKVYYLRVQTLLLSNHNLSYN